MRYVALEDTFYFKFTTRDFDTGAPQTLGGTPVISAYEDANLTQITAGITLTASYDSVTGMNHVAVVATAANGYEAGKYYSFVITTGTVDTVSVVGEVVHEIVIGPVDANVTTVAGTTQTAGDIPALVTTVDTVVDTIDTNVGTAGAGLTDLGGMSTAMKAEVNAEADTALSDYDPPTNTEMLAATAVTDALIVGLNDPTAAAIADAVWDETLTAHVTADSAAVYLKDIDTVVDAIQVKTDFLPSATAGAAGGVFIAGTNAATTITTGLTTTFTGNLTGSVGSVTGAVGSVTGAVGSVAGNVDGNVTGSVGSLAAQAKADVNAEVVDTLATDTYAELADVPAATVSLSDKLGWLYMLARNKVTQDATTQTLRNDADSADIGTSTVSDSAGTFTRGEWTDSA